MDDNREMELTPKFYEALKARGASEFEMAAFGYLEPAAQVVAHMLIEDGMPICYVEFT